MPSTPKAEEDPGFRFADDLGPEKIVHIYDPALGLKAVVVIDNVACGPAIGGVRMAPDVSTEECFRLARAMTFKSSAAGLPHGGGKSVIFGDPRMPDGEKERWIRAFGRAIAPLTDYIPGPDMGTNETCMAWLRDEMGRSVGLPAAIGGIPLDVIGATGYGVDIAVETAIEHGDLDFGLDGARVVVQGFGAVGRHAARFLAGHGAVLVAAADSKGTLYDPKGLDLARLTEVKSETGSVLDYPGGEKLGRDDVVGIPCDIWIPAARPDVLREDNVAALDAKLVVQGANIPVSPGAEAELHRRGILSLPDFIANAGGVICASVEYHGGGERQAFDVIAEKTARNTKAVLDRVAETGCAPREAALALAEERVREAMRYRHRP